MKTRDFIISIPYLCRAKNAGRWSKAIELQYDYELANKESAFSRSLKDELDTTNRFETAFGFKGHNGRIKHCKILCELLMLYHYKKQHNENHWDARIAKLEAKAKKQEVKYPDIYSTMSVEATRFSFWDG
jgi:hypothetical protein